ncbi:MAG: hypothetical protein ACK5UB_08790 [Pseudanabaena sp.]
MEWIGDRHMVLAAIALDWIVVLLPNFSSVDEVVKIHVFWSIRIDASFSDN